MQTFDIADLEQAPDGPPAAQGLQPLTDADKAALTDGEQFQPLTSADQHALGQAPTEGHPVKDFLGELHSLNPKDINRFLQQAFWHPIDTAKGIVGANDALRARGQEDFKRGDYVSGVRHFAEWAIPIATGVAGGAVGLATGGPVGAAIGLGGGYAGGVGVMQRVDDAAESLSRGDTAKALGATADAGAMIALPKAAEAAPQAVRATIGARLRPTPAPAVEAVQFARERGVGPIDAGTRTQSPYIKNLQKGVASTPGGHATAEAARAAQQEGLARVGSGLAAEIGPQAATTYGQAGEGLQKAFGEKIARHGQDADEQYAIVRGAGAQPQPPPAPAEQPPTDDAALARALMRIADKKMNEGDLGPPPPPRYQGGPEPTTAADEAIYAREIDAVLRPGFDKLVPQMQEPDGGFTYSATSGEQPSAGFAVSVYKGREVTLDAAVRADDLTNELSRYIAVNWDLLSQDGNYVGAWHDPASDKIYLDVSRVVPNAETANRIGAESHQLAYFDLATKKTHGVDYSVTKPEAHGQAEAEAVAAPGGAPEGRPDAGAPVRPGQGADRAGAVGGQEGGDPGGVGREGAPAQVGQPPDMRAPVDLRPAKRALKPYYDQVLETWPETQRAASPGFVALKRVVEGPDFRPADAVDQDLSLIKAIVRESPPMLRNRSQGLAAVAIGAIDPAVREAIYKAGGPEAAAALGRGRDAVKAKYASADVLGRLPKEPARIVAKLMAPRDSNAELLRTVAGELPDRIPDIGRAWLQAELDKATAEGGFARTDGLWADWDKLGPVTKRTVFGENLRSLNNFFLLAKKLGENPNPSGTAGVLTAVDRLTDVVKGGGVGGAAGYAVAGAPGAAVGSALGALLSRVPAWAMAKLLFSDRGAQALVTVLQAEADVPVKPELVAAATATIVSEMGRIAKEGPAALPKAAGEPDTRRPGPGRRP